VIRDVTAGAERAASGLGGGAIRRERARRPRPGRGRPRGRRTAARRRRWCRPPREGRPPDDWDGSL